VEKCLEITKPLWWKLLLLQNQEDEFLPVATALDFGRKGTKYVFQNHPSFNYRN
jgi:hypothetical protein